MDDDDLIVEGYRACRSCGEWVPEYHSFCKACVGKPGRKVDEAVIVEIEGHAVEIKEPKPRRRNPKRRPPQRNRPMEYRARDRARQRALFRLAAIYEDMFNMLFEEEQVREGLEPAPPRSRREVTSQAIETMLADLEEFHERVTLEATSRSEGAYPESQRPA